MYFWNINEVFSRGLLVIVIKRVERNKFLELILSSWEMRNTRNPE